MLIYKKTETSNLLCESATVISPRTFRSVNDFCFPRLCLAAHIELGEANSSLQRIGECLDGCCQRLKEDKQSLPHQLIALQVQCMYVYATSFGAKRFFFSLVYIWHSHSVWTEIICVVFGFIRHL